MTKLFSESIDDYLTKLLESAEADIRGQSETIIMAAGDEYHRKLVIRYSREAPAVNFDGVSVRPPKKRMVPRQRPVMAMNGEYINETEFNVLQVEYPFAGRSELFRFSNTFTVGSYLEAEIDRSTLILDYLYEREDVEEFKRWRQNTEKRLTDRLSEASAVYSKYASELPGRLGQMLLRRREEIESKNKFLTGLGVPVKATPY